MYDPHQEDIYTQNTLPYQPLYRQPAPKEERAYYPPVPGQHAQRQSPARPPVQQQTIARPQGMPQRPRGVPERPQGMPQRTYGTPERPQGIPQRTQQQTLAHPQAAPRQNNGAQQRMSKQDALSLAGKLKRGIIIASVIGFGTLGGLALGHVTGVTSNTNASSSTKQTSPATSSSNSSSSTNSSSSSSSSNSGGFQFGTTGSSAPITGSSTS